MLWYKFWLDTRARFFAALIILVLSGVGIVAAYPKVVALLSAAPAMPLGGRLSEELAAATMLSSTFRGYIWSQWLLKNLPLLWCFCAASLGAGGLRTEVARGGGLFTLSLPVSRRHLVLTRAAVILIELLVLAVLPPLLLPLLSPAVGESYAAGEAIVHGLVLFGGGVVLFGLSFLLSSFFADVWRPVLLAVGAAMLLGVAGELSPAVQPYTLFHTMSGESYFRGHGLPWAGLLASAGGCAAMIYGAVVSTAGQDF